MAAKSKMNKNRRVEKKWGCLPFAHVAFFLLRVYCFKTGIPDKRRSGIATGAFFCTRVVVVKTHTPSIEESIVSFGRSLKA